MYFIVDFITEIRVVPQGELRSIEQIYSRIIITLINAVGWREG